MKKSVKLFVLVLLSSVVASAFAVIDPNTDRGCMFRCGAKGVDKDTCTYICTP